MILPLNVATAPGPADAPDRGARTSSSGSVTYAGISYRGVAAYWNGYMPALALGRIGDPAAVPLLRWATDHRNLRLR